MAPNTAGCPATGSTIPPQGAYFGKAHALDFPTENPDLRASEAGWGGREAFSAEAVGNPREECERDRMQKQMEEEFLCEAQKGKRDRRET